MPVNGRRVSIYMMGKVSVVRGGGVGVSGRGLTERAVVDACWGNRGCGVREGEG